MYYLGKYLPAPLAGTVVRGISEALLALKPENYHGAVDNLSHIYAAIRASSDPGDASGAVAGQTGSRQTVEEEVAQAVRRLFTYSTLSYYHLFRNLGRGIDPDAFEPSVEMSSEVRGYLEAAAATGRGLFVLGSHMSAFDLCGIAFAHRAPSPPQALSLANPPSGFEFVNRLRSKGRGTITPISPETLREAMQRLRDGGIVLTGVDRPIPNGNEPVTFFGQTAYLPTGYIRIALKTDCLVMTMGFRYDGERYHIMAYPPMEMVRTGDRERDARLNVQRVLSQVEGFVRMAPDQWMVFAPVWPEGCHPAEAGCRN
jgi:phosphatidylinositol dimannoside acyltransferase